MKRMKKWSCGLAVLATAFWATAQQTEAELPGQEAGGDRAALEAKLSATLSNAVFTGRWCLITDEGLGPIHEDKYTLLAARKVGGDTWLIHARLQYGEREFVAPLPVQIKWAGETPVIVVDKLAMPNGGRAYSARVVIHGDSYAGTWSGGDHAGLLMGVIRRGEGETGRAEE